MTWMFEPLNVKPIRAVALREYSPRSDDTADIVAGIQSYGFLSGFALAQKLLDERFGMVEVINGWTSDHADPLRHIVLEWF